MGEYLNECTTFGYSYWVLICPCTALCNLFIIYICRTLRLTLTLTPMSVHTSVQLAPRVIHVVRTWKLTPATYTVSQHSALHGDAVGSTSRPRKTTPTTECKCLMSSTSRTLLIQPHRSYLNCMFIRELRI